MTHQSRLACILALAVGCLSVQSNVAFAAESSKAAKKSQAKKARKSPGKKAKEKKAGAAKAKGAKKNAQAGQDAVSQATGATATGTDVTSEAHAEKKDTAETHAAQSSTTAVTQASQSADSEASKDVATKSGDVPNASSSEAPPSSEAGKASEKADGNQKTATRPWAEGVAPESQRQALLLFREGNGLLKDSLFAQAAAKYREALAVWNHPAIHYNLVLALLNLDRPTEVLHHLEKAMAYGPEPIDPEKYEQARNYKVMIESQLAHLVIRCDQEGAVVSMDGVELFVGPGKFENFVRPGPHSIVAKKEGFVNNEMSPVLMPGQRSDYEMVLLTATEMTEYRRLWPVWRPWAVFGAGVVVAGVGAALHIKGRSDIQSYDEEINLSNDTLGTGVGLGGGTENIAGSSAGTILTADLENRRISGERNQKIAMAMYGVGGAAIIAGSILAFMNRLQPYIPESPTASTTGADAEGKDGSGAPGQAGESGANGAKTAENAFPEMMVLPVVSTEGAGVMASFRF